MQRARTWQVGAKDSTGRQAKRPSRPSLFDIEDDRDLKKARPDDDFTVKGHAKSRDPRRRPLAHKEAVGTPISASALSEPSFQPGDGDLSPLPTPRTAPLPGEKQESREREQEYPLSPRSKSPDIPESTDQAEKEKPRSPILRYSHTNASNITKKDSYSVRDVSPKGRSKSRGRDDLRIDARRQSKSPSPRCAPGEVSGDWRGSGSYPFQVTKMNSYRPSPGESRHFDRARRDRGSESARSAARKDLPTPKTPLPSSNHQSSSEETATPDTLQELTRLGELYTQGAVLAVKREQKEEELREQEKLSARYTRPNKAFQSLNENIKFRIDEITKDVQSLTEEQIKIDTAKAEVMTRLAAKPKNNGSASNSVSSDVDMVSREEFKELKRELRAAQRAREDIEERVSSLSRHTVMERDLESRGFVTKEQARKIFTDGNVALERKVASIDIDISKLRDNDARIQQLNASVTEMKTSQNEQADRNNAHEMAVRKLDKEITGKLDDYHEKVLRELKSSFIEEQESRMQVYLKIHLEDYVNSIRELQTSVGNIPSELRQTASAQVQPVRPGERDMSSKNTGPGIPEVEIDRIIRNIIDEEIKIHKHVLEQSEATLLEEISSLEKRTAECERRQVEEMALSERIPQLQTNVNKFMSSDHWQTQAILALQHTTFQQSRPSVVPSQPLTPPTTNMELGNLSTKIEIYERKCNELENHVKHMETFVRSQQQKFDGLSTGQLTQAMVDHLRKVYPYHPANVLGQIQNLGMAQRRFEAIIIQYGLKLNSLDIPSITRFITDFPSCMQQASDAKSHVALLRNLFDEYKAVIADQLQGSESKLEAQIKDERHAFSAMATSLGVRIDEIVETIKQETLSGAEQWIGVKKDLEELKSLKDSMLAAQNFNSAQHNTSDSDIEDNRRLIEGWRSRHHNTTTSEAAEPRSTKGTTQTSEASGTTKGTPEAPLNLEDLEDEDEIVNTRKRIKRSNKPSMQKRHGVSGLA